jgi:hypothetical protein
VGLYLIGYIYYTVNCAIVCVCIRSSLIGILTGDSASPDLWDAFLADFRPPADPDDVELGGVSIGNLEQADDMVLFSLSPVGLQ